MKFGVFYEHQLPRPWETDSEYRLLQDALEQARVEIVGAAHMEGVSANLRGKLNEECDTEGFSRMTRRDSRKLASLKLMERNPCRTDEIESARLTRGWKSRASVRKSPKSTL